MRALLCRFPELIFRLFVLFKNPAHIYGVRLFIDGKWETIVVDTSFFIDRSGSYCGVRSDGEKIWAMLLEKAFAKVNGSYEMIENGRA
jgi:calpain-15